MCQTFTFIRYLGLVLAVALHSVNTFAAQIEEKLPNGLYATADYRTGEDDKPAILIVHGFLTVHNFSLIQKMADELSDNDYTVLAPSLTLGINKRRESLACEALHLHTLDEDLAELKWWINWLVRKGHQNIILIGHSTGALTLIKLASQITIPQVSHLIAISMMPLEGNMSDQYRASVEKARQMVSDGNKTVDKFFISYCEGNYLSPPASFLSYAVIRSDPFINNLKPGNLNIKVILGSEDVDANQIWFGKLQDLNLDITIVEGANHFFNRGHEFELFESLVDALEDE